MFAVIPLVGNRWNFSRMSFLLGRRRQSPEPAPHSVPGFVVSGAEALIRSSGRPTILPACVAGPRSQGVDAIGVYAPGSGVVKRASDTRRGPGCGSRWQGSFGANRCSTQVTGAKGDRIGGGYVPASRHMCHRAARRVRHGHGEADGGAVRRRPGGERSRGSRHRGSRLHRLVVPAQTFSSPTNAPRNRRSCSACRWAPPRSFGVHSRSAASWSG